MHEVNSFIRGGSLTHIPKPYKRLYDDKRRKRPVEVRIICYGDYGGIGEHFYASVHEAGNPIWDADQNLWVYAWYDKDGDGLSFSQKFNSRLSAELWVTQILKKYFSRDTHKFVHWQTSRKFHYREDN